jgi:hypothetical protein
MLPLEDEKICVGSSSSGSKILAYFSRNKKLIVIDLRCFPIFWV